MNKLTLIFKFGILVILLSVQSLWAQTAISNIPSTDVIEPGSFYFEVNYGGHFGKYNKGGFQTYGVKALYGLNRNVEVGTNFAYTRNGETSPIEIAPNVKWKAYNNEKYKFAVSGGAMAFIPFKDEAGSRPSAFVYATASKGFDFANGFRLTAGVYTTVGAKADSGNKKGVMFGYEQTVFKKVSFVADWTSGKNRFGYTGAGLSIPFLKKNIFYAGYNFGNAGRGNNWLSIAFSRFI